MDDLNGLPDHLARALKALDAGAARSAARVDAGRVAEGVLKRLRAEPVREPAQRRRHGALRIAAAVALLAVAGEAGRRLLFEAPATPVVAAAVGLPVSVTVDSVDSAQATALLAAVEDARSAARGTDTAGTTTRTVSVDDLSEAELRTLLRVMETSEELE